MEYDINRPWLTLDSWQKEYIETPPEQDCFLLTGRQVGKTAAMSIKAVELCAKHFNKGENVLICSITEKQAYHMLSKALAYASENYLKFIKKGKDRPTMHSIQFTNGTGIYCYAAGETGEGLRGYTIKKLMIDEGSRMGEEFFIAVSPMLSVIHGSMDIASTPFGKKNKDGKDKFFYKCSLDEKFKKFYVSAEDCPRHSKEFLEGERKRLTKLAYAQEYLAIFTDELTQFFPKELIQKCMTIDRSTAKPGHYDRFMGVDIARMGDDETVLLSVERINREKLRMFELEIIKKELTTYTTNRIIILDKQYIYRKIYIDDGGLGVAVFDWLLKEPQTANNVEAINNSRRSLDRDDKRRKKLFKEDLYNNLLRLMEQGKIELFNDDEIYASLQSIQYEYGETGELRIWGSYSHIAEALIRAAWCIKDKTLNLWAECGNHGYV